MKGLSSSIEENIAIPPAYVRFQNEERTDEKKKKFIVFPPHPSTLLALNIFERAKRMLKRINIENSFYIKIAVLIEDILND